MMIMAIGIMGLAAASAFVLDATASKTFTVGMPAAAVQHRFQDVRTLEEHMPGVVAIQPHGEGRFLYRTVREIPFSGEMRTDFVIEGTSWPDGAAGFRTPDPAAANWMSIRFTVRENGPQEATVTMRLRVRLVRENGTDIHILAPVLGETFLSEHMEGDLASMLDVFVEAFLTARVRPVTAGGTP